MSFVLIPSIFLVALSYGTFWIQRSAVPARAAFCFIAFLSTINNTKGALSALPKLSAGDAWMLGVLSKSQYFCAYTVVEVVMANYLLHIETRVKAALKEVSEKEDLSGSRSATADVRALKGGQDRTCAHPEKRDHGVLRPGHGRVVALALPDRVRHRRRYRHQHGRSGVVTDETRMRRRRISRRDILVRISSA